MSDTKPNVVGLEVVGEQWRPGRKVWDVGGIRLSISQNFNVCGRCCAFLICMMYPNHCIIITPAFGKKAFHSSIILDRAA